MIKSLKHIGATAVLLGLVWGCATEEPVAEPGNTYRISGDIAGLTEDWSVADIKIARSYDQADIATVETDDGTFEYVGVVDRPTVLIIRAESEERSLNYCMAVVEPGAEITVAYYGPVRGIYADGGGLHAELVSSWSFSDEYLTAGAAYEEYMERQKALEAEAEADEEGVGESSEAAAESSLESDEETLIASEDTESVSEETDDASTGVENQLVAVADETETSDETEADEAAEEEDELPEGFRLYNAIMDVRWSHLDESARSENAEVALLAIELGGLSATRDNGDEVLRRLDEIGAELSDSLGEEEFKLRITDRRSRVVGYMERLAADESLQPGDAAPTFTAVSVDGDEHDLAQVLAANDVVLVDFWASWCGPCIKTFPHLKEMYTEYGDRGFEIVSVSIDDTDEDWSEASEEHELPWLDLGDISETTGPIAQAWGVTFIPKGYVLDAEGQILDKDLSTDDLEALLVERFATDDVAESNEDDSEETLGS